jgi:hypothetical protein
MRRFTIVAPKSSVEDLCVWEDTSFKLVEKGTWDDPEQGPDVFLWHWAQAEDMPVQMILSLLPKLFIVVSAPVDKVSIPGELADIFSIQIMAGDSILFTIGSRLQGLADVPDWDAFRGHAAITREEQIKAVSGSIYRYLLEDVIRETAEWCGHMSSVVGQM